MGRDLPSGTVTFLFTDVEGSTKLLHVHGAEGYAAALAEHRRLLREAFARHGGVEVDTQGDAFFVAFPTAPGALAAATEATEALNAGPIRIRIGLHTGTPLLTDEGYVGPDVHRAARIAAAGHGGQVLVSSATAALLHGPGLRDLGQHRLKDLSAPERIHQLGDGDFPPLKTLHQTNLPVPATAFLGREAEVAEVSELLARDEVRLMTLTGPGGTGKTRLALAVAGGAAERYPDGVWWVPLAPLRDPALVLESAAAALGASRDLAEHIGDKRLLLLLDNIEHLMPAADALAPLLAACPNLELLVTSREPLHISGEHEYGVDPLRGPEAVLLFLTRAMAAGRDVTPDGEIAQICERLDHLPLAIELAAARVKILSPRALLERLEQRLPVLAGGARDLPERQRTLRATIAWSHELLTDDEQRLFARLSVFQGGCTLDDAEAVADADLDTVQSLVDKSLLRVRDDRFWMLETIGEYAAEQLDASGEADEIRERQSRHVLQIAEDASEAVVRDDGTVLRQLGIELPNFRATLEWSIGRSPALAVTVMSRLWPVWEHLGLIREGLHWAYEALAASPEESRERAALLRGVGIFEYELGDRWRAQDRVRASLELARRLGDDGTTWRALNTLASISDDSEAAAAWLEECLQVQRRASEEGAAPFVNLAWVSILRGDRDRAVGLLEESLAVAKRTGEHGAAAASLTGLAWMALFHGEPALAWRHAARALEAAEEAGDAAQAAESQALLARAELRQGRPEAAGNHLAASIAKLEEGEWEEPGAFVLATAAELLVARRQHVLAATLLAAASSLRGRFGLGRWAEIGTTGLGAWIDIIEPDEWLYRKVLSSEEARVAYERGAETPTRDALVHAKEWIAEAQPAT